MSKHTVPDPVEDEDDLTPPEEFDNEDGDFEEDDEDDEELGIPDDEL